MSARIIASVMRAASPLSALGCVALTCVAIVCIGCPAAAEPRPTVGMPRRNASRAMSHTTRKYEAKPVRAITSSS